MEEGFPQESYRLLEDKLEGYTRFFFGKPKRVDLARGVNDGASIDYGFHRNLETGLYAPFPHEARERHINKVNCTNAVPYAFIAAKIFGLDPRILGFSDRTEYEGKRPEDLGQGNTHYAISVDVGREHRFLIDPQYGLLGPILQMDGKKMVVGKNGGSKKTTVEYSELTSPSEAEFAAMMRHLQTNEGALEALEVGQRVSSQPLKKKSSSLMIFYDDEASDVSLRLYNWVPLVSDRAIVAHNIFDENGDHETTLDFFYAQKNTFGGMLGAKMFGHLPFRDAIRLERKLLEARGSVQEKGKRKTAYRRRLRMKSILDKIGAEASEDILSLGARAMLGVGAEGLASVGRNMLLRTLYEGAPGDEPYLYTEEERNERLAELIELDYEALAAIDEVNKESLFEAEVATDPDKAKLRKLRRKHGKEAQVRERVTEKLNPLRILKMHDPSTYHRTADALLFTEREVEGTDHDFLLERVEREGLEMTLGHLAMLEDHLPLISERQARKYLTLEHFGEDIRRKFLARRAAQRA